MSKEGLVSGVDGPETPGASTVPCEFSLCGGPIQYGRGRPPKYHTDRTWGPDAKTCRELGLAERALARVYEASGQVPTRRLDLDEFTQALRDFDDAGLDPLRQFAEAVHALDGRVGQAHALLRQEVADARAAEERAQLAAAAADRRASDAAAAEEAMRAQRDAAAAERDTMRVERDEAIQGRTAAEDSARLAISARDVLAAERDDARRLATAEATARGLADTAAAEARAELATRDAELEAAKIRVTELTSELQAARAGREEDGRRYVTKINDLHTQATAARDELRRQLTADHERRSTERDAAHRAELAQRGQEHADAQEQLRTELAADAENRLTQAAILHEQQRSALAAQVEGLTGRAERAEADATRTQVARDRYADELHTLREALLLELAQDPDAAPLAGRIAAALGAGARRMARDAAAEPDAGPGPAGDGESR